MPRWQLAVLLSEQPRIEAQRLNAAVTAASSPHMEKSARGDLIRRITRIASPPKAPAAKIAKQSYDPEAAKTWFASRGVRVEVA